MFAAFIWLLMFPGVFVLSGVFGEPRARWVYSPAPRACLARHFGPGPRM